MNRTLLKRAQELGPQLTAWRRDFHRNPELSFKEYRTAGVVADVLQSLGWRVTTGVGGTGVVGELGEGGALAALRADMDAIPIQELNQVDYASQVPGVMHGCGHDAHTACLLGAAALLKGVGLSGRVRLLFQPAEEDLDADGKSGATYMIRDGAMDGVDAVFAQHVDGQLPAGTLAVSPGYVMAAMDNFSIEVLGRGAHAAQAYMGVDAILLSAHVVTALNTVVGRRVAPLDSAVVSVGLIHGGTRENNLADKVELKGTLRSFDPETRQALWREVEQACAMVRAEGGDYRLTIRHGYPVTVNDATLAELTRRVAEELAGTESVRPIRPEMGAEDFAFLLQRAPGTYFMLGAGSPGQPWRNPHHANFDIDESALPLGAAMMAGLALEYLEHPLRRQEKV